MLLLLLLYFVVNTFQYLLNSYIRSFNDNFKFSFFDENVLRLLCYEEKYILLDKRQLHYMSSNHSQRKREKG